MRQGFPSNLARGITDSACVSDSEVLRCAYTFDKRLGLDGRRELSIQWLDDAQAEKEMKSRLRKGEPTYIRGFAVLRTDELDQVCKEQEYYGLTYERNKSMNNPYHGLIKMNEVEDKMARKMITSELALRSTFYPYEARLPVG